MRLAEYKPDRFHKRKASGKAGGIMYKKYAVLLLLINMIMGVAAINLEERNFLLALSKIHEQESKKEEVVIDIEKVINTEEKISGNQPVLEVLSIQRPEEIALSPEDRMILYKIVEAEAGTEDRKGKILVANVVLNRLEDDSFPDTIEEVVYQQEDGVTQFSPVANGSFEKAVPKENTIEAVDAALAGEDYSEGALYFAARQYADDSNMEWFDKALTKVVEHGGHEFYR